MKMFNDMVEIWHDIEGFGGCYQVSNLGRVKSLKFGKEKILNAMKKNGYLRVDLCKDGIKKRYMVHRLVAFAFLPNPDNLPEINHKDENKENNMISNLEWCDRKYNTNYGTRNIRSAESNGKKVLCIETGKIYPSTKQVERILGFNQSNISAVCRGKRKRANGFHWRYIY